jgi:hypothetical protein
MIQLQPAGALPSATNQFAALKRAGEEQRGILAKTVGVAYFTASSSHSTVLPRMTKER